MLKNMDKCIDPRDEQYLQSVFVSISRTMGFSTPTEAIANFRTMMGEMEMLDPISENKVRDIEILSQSVNPVRLKNNPIRLEMISVVSIYAQILK